MRSDALLSALGHRVREARARRGMTISALSDASGISRRFLSDLEAGRGNISISRLADLAGALGVPLARLLDGDAQLASPPAGREQLLEELNRLSDDEIDELRSWLRSRNGPARPYEKVALIGLRGAGKSTVGARVARRLKIPFVELDRRVEQAAGMSLGTLFSIHGEPYYRRLEQEVLREIIGRPGRAIIAAGGGIVANETSYELLRSACLTIWLEATPEDHWSRVVAQGDERPMRGNPQAMAELRAILARRRPLYARAHRRVDTSALGLRATVDAVATWARSAKS